MNSARRPVWLVPFADGAVHEVDVIKTLRHQAELLGRRDPFSIQAGMWQDLADQLTEGISAAALADLAKQKDAEANKLREQARVLRVLRKAQATQDKANRQLGADATRDAANVLHKDLDDKIRACLVRGEQTKRYSKAWADEHKVDLATVYRRITAVKKAIKEN